MFFFIIPSGESYCNDRSKEFSEKIFMRGGPSIMATTRIMPLHVGKGRTESRAISDIIDYVANPQKTDEYSGQQVYTVRLLGNRLEIM